MNDGPNAAWLPNLVGGVSIWKLAVDLNEPQFFDGRLLVPQTEGSESLPVTVRWNLSTLLPLAEARAKVPADVDLAVKDFQAALGRVARVFSTLNGRLDKYKAAFTVPSVEANDGGNYFYSPEQKKLYVINWGASPRSMAGRAESVFGYEDWGRAWTNQGGGGIGSVSALAADEVPRGGAAAIAGTAAEKTKRRDDKREKHEGRQRSWWLWPLLALTAIAVILVALFLLKACEEQTNVANADGGETGAEAAAGTQDGAAPSDGANQASGDAAGTDYAQADARASDDGGKDAATSGDAGKDASGDAGKDAGDDAGKDAGKDAAASDDSDDDDTDSDIEIGPDGRPVPGGKVTVTFGGAPGGQLAAAKKGPHRRHFQSEAVKWRISAGNDRVTRTEARGRRFDVWLAPGRTFQGVGMDWQDKSGKWHAH